MKQVEDNKTMELLDEPKRGRGRPRREDGPVSAADRQKARRQRLRAAGIDYLTIPLPVDVLASLKSYAAAVGETREQFIERIVRRELMHKPRFK